MIVVSDTTPLNDLITARNLLDYEQTRDGS
jgi:hypothetical protein